MRDRTFHVACMVRLPQTGYGVRVPRWFNLILAIAAAIAVLLSLGVLAVTSGALM